MTGWFFVFAAQAAIVAAGLMAFGYLIADALTRRRQLDAFSRWALAFPAVVAFSFVVMIFHIASRGRILSNPWLVRALTSAFAAALIVRKIRRGDARERISGSDVIAATGVVVVALLLWATPVLRVVPLVPASTDTKWHMGWASQLMNGETTPSTLLTGDVPNYYPWLFHGLVAFVASFTPGGRAYHTLGPLQILQVVGAALALFSLGRLVGRTWIAGASVALFGSMAAGLAVALIDRFDAVIRTPRGGGPRGTYNASYNNLAPPLPRDLGYTLLLAFLLLLVAGLVERNPVLLAGAGTVLGLAGLTSAEFFFVGLAVAVVIALLGRDLPRSTLALTLLGPAIGLYAIWLAPLIASYVRLGGFVNTTGVGPIVLSPVAILMSWGLVTPLAAYAVVRWLPAHRADPGARVLVVLVFMAAAFVLTSSAIPGLLGPGFLILGRATRYWPIVHLALALFAGMAAAELIQRTAAWQRVAGIGVAALLLGFSLPVPISASLAVARASQGSAVLGSAILGIRSSYLTEIGQRGRAMCVVAAPERLPLLTFSYTGYRHVGYRGLPRHVGNFARIRWRDIYRRIHPETERLADNRILTTARAPIDDWRRLSAKYGVNLVVAEGRDVDAFRKVLPTRSAGFGPRPDPYAVLPIVAC